MINPNEIKEVETLYVAGIRRLTPEEAGRVGGGEMEQHYQAVDLEGEVDNFPIRFTALLPIETPWALGDWLIVSRQERPRP